MSIVLHDSRPSVALLPRRISALMRAVRQIEFAWRQHRQAALLWRIDGETCADIGYSRDYIRTDWADFAAQYPDTVAPATIVRRRDNG